MAGITIQIIDSFLVHVYLTYLTFITDIYVRYLVDKDKNMFA